MFPQSCRAVALTHRLFVDRTFNTTSAEKDSLSRGKQEDDVPKRRQFFFNVNLIEHVHLSLFVFYVNMFQAQNRKLHHQQQEYQRDLLIE